MTCIDFQNQLQAMIESRVMDDREALASHAESCKSCRETWEQHAILEAVIPAWKAQVPQVDLADKVMLSLLSRTGTVQQHAATSSNNTARPTQRRGSFGIVMTAAACLFLAAQLALRSRDNSAERITTSQPNEVQQSPNQSGDESLVANDENQSSSNGANNYKTTSVQLVNLSYNAVESVTEIAKSVVPGGQQTSTEQPSASNIGGWIDQIEPFGERLDRAMDRLINTLDTKPSNS